MARIERTKIDEVIENDIGNVVWTSIGLLEPTKIHFENGESEEVRKITIKGGTISKKGKYDWGKGRNINFENRIPDGRASKITNQVTVIENKNNNIVLEIEGTDEENVIDWINDGFSVVFTPSGQIINPLGDTLANTNKNAVNWGEIYPAIREYVRNNPEKFYLEKDGANSDDGISFDRDGVGNGLTDRWWCKVVSEEEAKNLITISPHGRVISGTRRILFGSASNQQKALNFIFFTPEQYEELKQLLPDNQACKIEGCYNNHCRFGGVKEIDTKVENGLCGYHRAQQEGVINENIQEESQQSNNNLDLDADAIRENINKARNTYENSNDLTEINQAINDLENIKINNTDTFDNWLGEEVLNWLKSKKMILDDKNNEENEGSNTNINGEENPESTHTPLNDTSSPLQTAKDNAIREITTALVNQEPKLTTKHDLSEDNRDWKKEITAADNENDILNIRDKVLADIVAKRKAKKEAENIVNNLETEGKDADQLKKQLEEVEKSRGQQIYEDNQSGIDNLKNELAEKVSDEEYCQIITDNIEKNMAKYNIKVEELDPEIKKELEKMKSGGVKDKSQINETEKKIAKNVGQKGSEKKLNKIIREAQEALKLGDKNKIKAAKNKLYSFLVSNDIYEKSLLSQKKNNLQNLLKKLENYSGQKQTIPDKFPWKIVIPVAFILIVITTLGIIIYRKRKKKLKA